jgi:hypothetical protein
VPAPPAQNHSPSIGSPQSPDTKLTSGLAQASVSHTGRVYLVLLAASHGCVKLRLPDECQVILEPLFRQRHSRVFSCEAVERLSPSDIVRSMHEYGKGERRGSCRADHERRLGPANPLDSMTALRRVQEVVAVGL